jgi:hypothetical protein
VGVAFWEAAASALPELDRGRFQTALFWLYDGGYITATVAPQRWSIEVTGAKPKGLRAVGAWPNVESELARLTALLDAQIEAADGETKTKLERFRDALLGMGQNVATGLLKAYLERYLPPA